ncbi:prolyl aminopeptidase [Boudabousia liubingyangii]|nr:prolyl aminopeptidase [Boudabousia liubingyangii]
MNDSAQTQQETYMYPHIEPYQAFMLPVSDDQKLYVECSGNPDGIPVIFLHGGPGGGSNPMQRRNFNPDLYQIILFDQRGSGRSLPHAWEPEADLSTNTTWKLVEDIEAIRLHLGIERWVVSGGSWGSTLSLAYAETHPERVLALLLRGIFTLRKEELDWFYEGTGAHMIYADEWEKYVAAAGPDVKPGGYIQRYHELLSNPDPEIHGPAALAWTTWEAATSTLLPDEQHVDDVQDPSFATTFARIENHFFINQGWMEDGQLIDNATILEEHGIPGMIVQGRYDVVCPMKTAWDLHRNWPSSKLSISKDAGHAMGESTTMSQLTRYADELAELLSQKS